MTSNAPPEGAELALAIYVEELARDARVLWMGEAGSGATRLSASAAALEVLPPPRRSRGSRRGGRLATRGWLGPADAESYQLVVVPDALASGLADQSRLEDVKRSVAPGGVVVLATEAQDGSYERFYEHAAAAFDVVRMLGITPFSGVSIVDFAGADGTTVSLDGSALAGSQPEPMLRWIALCGAQQKDVEPYLVVQLPFAPRDAGPREAARLDAPAEVPVAAPVAPAPSSAAAERELEAARARLEHSEKRLEQAQREIARNGQKLDELRHEIERANAALAERAERSTAPSADDGEPSDDGETAALGEEVNALERRLAAQGRELTELRVEGERRSVIVRDLVEQLAAARAAQPVAVAVVRVEEPVSSDATQRRVAEAEASRAAAVFRADELAGEVALLRAQLEHARTVSAPEDTARIRVELASQAGARIDQIQAEAAAQLAATRAEHATQLEAARSEIVRLGAARAEAIAALEVARGELDAERASVTERIDAVRAEAAERAREARVEGATELARERAGAKDRDTKTAEREGTIRGLMSRAAELDEMRLQTEARLSLALSDIAALKGEKRHLEAQLGSVQEELELAMLQRRQGPAGGDRAVEMAEAAAERSRLEAEVTRLRAALVIAEQELEAAHETQLRRVASIEVERDAALASARSASMEIETLRTAAAEIESLRREADEARGERQGLAMRLADAEAALADHIARGAELETIRTELETISTERSAASTALGGLRSEHGALSDRLARAEAERDAERQRVAGLVARLASRDGLLQARQSHIAQAAEKERALAAESAQRIASLEARLEASAESLAAFEAVSSVREGELGREEAELRARLTEAESAGSHAAGRVRAARSALEEIRGALASAIEGQRLVVSEAGAAPSSSRDVDRLKRELDDRELMLRSLTAQLEERDDRLRALERPSGPSGSGDVHELRQRILVAEEREHRLRSELESARRRPTESSASEHQAERRRLEQLAADREAHAMQVEGALATARREEQVLREVIAQTRADVEAALSGVGIEPAGDTAERLAEALRLLQRL